ncbi:transcriptional regulator [Streptomyces sulfonofaciens]|uniref:Transcriptional regulator n=1 Tax=Streptomyces sulfonofaciens TaxID=68272 RepID=A0A919G2E4_9ACTN|nr:ROK family transcriptional regulator [Streptomyces sulfonofaciens]GHH76641.1 transcriptional regulator [Streptomyces sulfonofaciens]
MGGPSDGAARGSGPGWPSGANLPALRGHNTALVLDLLRVAGGDGISRRELAERTGLTPQAVSKITARLRTAGLAAPAGRRASTGGKPPTALRLVPGARHAVGLHLDRDACTAVLVDLAGAVVAERRGPLDLGAGADEVLDLVVREVRALTGAVGAGGPATADAWPPAGRAVPGPDGPRSAGVLGAGVAVPGPLDHRLGVLHRVTGFPEWDGFPLREALTGRLGLPVAVDKDTNAAALGLALRAGLAPTGAALPAAVPSSAGAPAPAAVPSSAGAPAPGGGTAPAATAFPYGSFAYLHLGTGLGAGLVFGGTVHRGARTGAGEFGHQVIRLDGPRCSCGNRGCIEALCLDAVAHGDIDGAARVLGEGAANLIALLDVDRVLLGGRTLLRDPDTEARFVRGVDAVLTGRARRAGWGRAVPVAAAPGGPRAVAEGAAQLLLAPLFGRASAVAVPSAPVGWPD